jgi:hypothetical protein
MNAAWTEIVVVVEAPVEWVLSPDHCPVIVQSPPASGVQFTLH